MVAVSIFSVIDRVEEHTVGTENTLSSLFSSNEGEDVRKNASLYLLRYRGRTAGTNQCSTNKTLAPAKAI